MATKVFLRLFVGVLITSEIRMHLNLSIKWKEAQILKELDPNRLTEVHFHHDNYAGKFLPHETFSLDELKLQEQEILAKLKGYCPKLGIEKIKLKIFPQQFIS
ncbi:MAG: hypothetical protein ACSNEK_06805 [Parachlamydiaceae bacterium]